MTNTQDQDREKVLADLEDVTARLTTGGRHTTYVCGKAKTFTTPSPIEQLHIMVAGSAGAPRGGATGNNGGSSRPPLNVTAVDLQDAIRSIGNNEAIRLSGVKRYCYDVADAAQAWSTAARRSNDLDEMRAVIGQFRNWINRIETMTTPPIIQELNGTTCPACHNTVAREVDEDGITRLSPTMVIRVKERESEMACRSCGATWNRKQLKAMGSWVHGETEEETDARLGAAPKVKRPRPDQGETLEELREYAAKHGHLPPANAGTFQERRLSQWLRRHTRNKPSNEQGIIRRNALDKLIAEYPSKSEANAQAKTATERAAA